MSGGNVFEKAGCSLSVLPYSPIPALRLLANTVPMVMVQVVYGSMPPEAVQAATERGVDRAAGMAPGESVPFFACGLSSVRADRLTALPEPPPHDLPERHMRIRMRCASAQVMHPRNPMAPTMHFNYRYFETGEQFQGSCALRAELDCAPLAYFT